MDAWSRKIVGWAIADHIRTELVMDALDMARWQRRPAPGAVLHADRGSQYTSWLFGHRLREAGILGSMVRVASSQDNAAMESFWSVMQRELLDRRSWPSRVELASAIFFEWIEGWYNPRRRHSGLGMLSPHEFETLAASTNEAASSNQPNLSGETGQAPRGVEDRFDMASVRGGKAIHHSRCVWG